MINLRIVMDINKIRYLNLFEKITRIRARNCFLYNNVTYFVVPRNEVFNAIGKNSENLRRIGDTLNKKVKVIAAVNKMPEAPEFISQIISPLKLKDIQIKEKEIIIDAGDRQTKALLMGRDKKKLEELKKIINESFGCELRVL